MHVKLLSNLEFNYTSQHLLEDRPCQNVTKFDSTSSEFYPTFLFSNHLQFIFIRSEQKKLFSFQRMTLGSTRDHSDDEDRQVHKRPRYSSEDEENEVEVIVEEEGSTTDTTPSIIEYNETSLPVDDQDG